jgi:hypothetical protein
MKRLLAVLVAVCGCSMFTAQLTEKGARVQLREGDPPSGCRELGDVRGDGSLENAKIRMRNQAGELGANYIRWETVAGHGTVANGVTGTAYSCAQTASS